MGALAAARWTVLIPLHREDGSCFVLNHFKTRLISLRRPELKRIMRHLLEPGAGWGYPEEVCFHSLSRFLLYFKLEWAQTKMLRLHLYF